MKLEKGSWWVNSEFKNTAQSPYKCNQGFISDTVGHAFVRIVLHPNRWPSFRMPLFSFRCVFWKEYSAKTIISYYHVLKNEHLFGVA